MKAKIIYNPKSGKRKLQPRMSDVVELLSKAGYRVEVYPTKQVGDASRAAEIACEESYDLVIAVGGDGTASEVVNGLARHERRPALSYIPSGTCNDFAISLDLPSDLEKAVEVATRGNKVNIDIGRFNGKRTFNYFLGVGAFTGTAYTTPHSLKRRFGFSAYLKDMALELPAVKNPMALSLRVDDQLFSGEYSTALVLNSPGFAGLRKIIPSASMDDGLLHVLLFPKGNLRVLWAVLRGMFSGVDDSTIESGIQYIRGERIFIESDKPIKWNLDGEMGGCGHNAEIICQKGFLEVMVPDSAFGKLRQDCNQVIETSDIVL